MEGAILTDLDSGQDLDSAVPRDGWLPDREPGWLHFLSTSLLHPNVETLSRG